MSAARRRAAAALRAVRVLEHVVVRKRKLEPTFDAACDAAKLEAGERGVLRDICSGTLRYLDLVQLYLIRNVEKSYMVRSYYRYLMALALV